MTLLTLKILGGVAALAFGLYLGKPRPFEQPLEEIDERLGQKTPRKSARKHFTFLNMLQRRVERGSHRRMAKRRTPFKR